MLRSFSNFASTSVGSLRRSESVFAVASVAVGCVRTFATRDDPHTFKQAQRGLYHGRRKTFGNNVSFSHRKTRRSWKPNVQTKRLYSELLDKTLKLRITSKALKCIDKAGGLDNYLLYTKPNKLASLLGVQLQDVLKQRFLELTGVKFRRFYREENDKLVRQMLDKQANEQANETTTVTDSITPNETQPST